MRLVVASVVLVSRTVVIGSVVGPSMDFVVLFIVLLFVIFVGNLATDSLFLRTVPDSFAFLFLFLFIWLAAKGSTLICFTSVSLHK